MLLTAFPGSDWQKIRSRSSNRQLLCATSSPAQSSLKTLPFLGDSYCSTETHKPFAASTPEFAQKFRSDKIGRTRRRYRACHAKQTRLWMEPKRRGQTYASARSGSSSGSSSSSTTTTITTATTSRRGGSFWFYTPPRRSRLCDGTCGSDMCL